MITNDEQLHQAQQDIQTMWRFLEAARETHSPLDYQRLAVPYLLQLQEPRFVLCSTRTCLYDSLAARA